MLQYRSDAGRLLNVDPGFDGFHGEYVFNDSLNIWIAVNQIRFGPVFQIVENSDEVEVNPSQLKSNEKKHRFLLVLRSGTPLLKIQLTRPRAK